MYDIVKRFTMEERNRINKLTSILLKEKRYDDLQRATEDDEFQEKLLEELVPDEIAS